MKKLHNIFLYCGQPEYFLGNFLLFVGQSPPGENYLTYSHIWASQNTLGKKMHYIFGTFRPLQINHVCDNPAHQTIQKTAPIPKAGGPKAPQTKTPSKPPNFTPSKPPRVFAPLLVQKVVQKVVQNNGAKTRVFAPLRCNYLVQKHRFLHHIVGAKTRVFASHCWFQKPRCLHHMYVGSNIYIYIYVAVELLSGPSLALLNVIIWSKFVF